MTKPPNAPFDRHRARRLRESWAMVRATQDGIGRAFYDNLFRLAPETRGMFGDDLARQATKLERTFDALLADFEDPNAWTERATTLAVRHLDYGVTEAHYHSLGPALIAALRQVLGPRITAEDEAAWAEAYRSIADVMIRAAYRDRY